MKTFLIASLKYLNIDHLKKSIDFVAGAGAKAVKCDLPIDLFEHVKKYCDGKIELISSFTNEDLLLRLRDSGLDRVYINLPESSDSRILRFCGRIGLPLLIQWNMECLEPVDILEEVNCCDVDVNILYSSDTPDVDKANLFDIATLADICLVRGYNIGYVDYINDIFSSALSIALGATILDKPFIDQESFNQQVKVIKEAERRLKYSSVDKVTKRVICTKIELQADEVLNEDNISTCAGYDGIDASRYGEIVTLGARSKDFNASGRVIKNVYYKHE